LEAVYKNLEESSAAEGTSSQIDVLQLVSLFRRRLKLFVAVILVVFGAAALLTFQQTPQYTATARVVIDQRKQQVIQAEQSVVSNLPNDSSAVDTEVEILRSRSIAEKVAEQAGIFKDPNWAPRPGLLKTIADIFSKEESKDDSVIKQQSIVDGLLSGLDVNRTNDTFMIDVSYTLPDAAQAAKFANLFADTYITDQISSKFDATQRAVQWLNDRLGSIRQQVDDANAAVQAYKIKNNLLSSQGATLTEQEISTLDQQLALARAEAAEQAARLSTAKAQLARGSNGEDVGEALTSPVVQSLRQQRATASQKVADLAGRYGERHPDLLKARRELADIDGQIQQEIKRIISNLEAQTQVAQQHVASIQASVNSTRSTLAENNTAGVKLNELQRNADAANTLYQSFLDRFKQTTAQQGMEQSDARVISKATIPTSPSKPRIALNLMLGFLISLILATIAIIVAEIFDSGITTADDIEHDFHLPALGNIPILESVADDAKGVVPYDYVVNQPLSGFSECFRMLRSSLLLSRAGQTVKTIAVTSSLSNEGKTTTSICLARVSALAGDKVLLVDCDTRKRSLNIFLPKDQQAGLFDVISGQKKLEDVIVLDEPSGAWILPLGRSPFTPRDIFASKVMTNLLLSAEKEYSLIILDAPPVLAVADTRFIVNEADAVMMLVHWRTTPRKAVESSLKVLASSNAFVAGVALSRVNQHQQSRFGYGDPSYYYGSYKKYYT
jgi:capsular exopolysaccharide synthesis family protein